MKPSNYKTNTHKTTMKFVLELLDLYPVDTRSLDKVTCTFTELRIQHKKHKIKFVLELLN